ncbi:substrate-binding domain-containing protein [Butyrivibrio sp. JL13D10]|uniref:substrate-binding domain-containing protein n=1 Tax=Butyrivibrio sp. JL13D10 TaxID=3236815 RepID=UPI0038B63E29
MNKRNRKYIYILLALSALLILMTGCYAKKSDKKIIGISAPSNEIQRWALETVQIRDELYKRGYDVITQYASNDVAMQINQIENMIAQGAEVLIIIPVESASLGEAMDMAKEHNIPVISYDMLITNTDAVSYYTTFDNYGVGRIMGEYVRGKLDLDNASRTYNIEFTSGNPGDNNAAYFFNGAKDVLQPYLDNGVLNIVSGQTTFTQCSTPGWSTEKAQHRAENILASFYQDTDVDIWISGSDITSLGIIGALGNSYNGSYPLITGQDCSLLNVKYIMEGKQAMSVFKDPTLLIEATTNMVDEILSGKEVTVNDTETYFNGIKTVPSYLCKPVYIDADNYEDVLISSGFYTKEQLLED